MISTEQLQNMNSLTAGPQVLVHKLHRIDHRQVIIYCLPAFAVVGVLLNTIIKFSSLSTNNTSIGVTLSSVVGA